ncbi:hypothetical protein Tco_1319314 [Tanacetum coccineum]
MFSNNIDLLLEECVSKDVTCSYLHLCSDLNANTDCKAYVFIKSRSECHAQAFETNLNLLTKEVHNNLLKVCKLEKHSISLELSLQHCKEQMKNNPVCKENASILVNKRKVLWKLSLIKPSVVRQPNAQRIPKPSVLGKPTPFSNSPGMRDHDACVSRYLKDVNASKPKKKANKSVATPHKKTTQKPLRIKVEFSRLFVLGGFQLETYSSHARQVDSEPAMVNRRYASYHACKHTLGFKSSTSFNGQKQQRIDITADALYNEKQENLRAPFLNVQMTSVHISSGLVLHQMTSDHNRSELGIQDHSNEPSSSKLVPKVVP